MGTTEIILALVGGFFAGILNTLAGFGSIITLAIYMDVLGLPGHIANMTNRVNVFFNSAVSAGTFSRYGKVDMGGGKWIIMLVVIGAMIGAFLATRLDEEGFKQVFKYLLLFVLAILLMNPKRFIEPDPDRAVVSPWITAPLYIAIGIYAGFIQAGFGVLFLMVAVMLSNYGLIKANGLKLFIVAIYTIGVLLYFQLNGTILWKYGLLIASGQAVGGYLTARNMSRMEGANKWAYRLLVLVVVLVTIKNFEVWTWF